MSRLIEACKIGDVWAVREALAEGADPDAKGEDGWAGLHWAAQENYPEVIRALAEAGADLNVTGRSGITPLALAVGEEQDGAVLELIRLGANPDFQIEAYGGGTVLHLASAWGSLRMVQYLLAASSRSSQFAG